MQANRSLRHQVCLIQRTLIDLCLRDEDLRSLGLWQEGDHPSGFSSRLRTRALLQRLLARDERLARYLDDLLDLRHLDTVQRVHHAEESALEAEVHAFLAGGGTRDLAGLVWACCTDPRPRVQGLGHVLCHEAVTLGCRLLAGSHDGAPR